MRKVFLSFLDFFLIRFSLVNNNNFLRFLLSNCSWLNWFCLTRNYSDILLIYFEVLSVIIELELVISNGIYHASNLSCLLSFLILSLFFSLD